MDRGVIDNKYTLLDNLHNFVNVSLPSVGNN